MVGSRGRAAIPFAVVTIISLWLARSFWLPGGFVVGFDTYAYSGPNLDVTREAIRAGMERLQGNWEFFVQQVHPGWISIDGDTATGRAYTEELGRFTDGTSHANYAIYHDTFRRTPDGWKFTERVYEFRYRDDSTLPGTGAPRP